MCACSLFQSKLLDSTYVVKIIFQEGKRERQEERNRETEKDRKTERQKQRNRETEK